MQSISTPPQLGQIIFKTLLWIFGFIAVLFIGIPFGMLFPYFAYLALYHTARLLPFTMNYVQSLFDNSAIFPFGGAIAIFGVWAGINAYRAQRRQWQAHQESVVLESAKTRTDDDPVPLPPPTALPVLQVEIHDRLTSSMFLMIEVCWIVGAAIAYLAWAQILFHWPSNQNLDHSIIGSAVGIFLLGSVITLWCMPSRRIVVDHVGITVKTT